MHTYQMCILMLFNTGDKLSFADIQSATNIPADELTRHLLSLAHPQVKLLLKNPPGKACAPDHRFKYNTKYASKLYRNKIAVLSKAAAGVGVENQGADGAAASAASSSSSSSSSSSLPASIVESRQFSVEASIVRIMKSRKTLEHSALMAEVVHQLSSKFPVESQFVKKRIEALIERDYLERDPNNRYAQDAGQQHEGAGADTLHSGGRSFARLLPCVSLFLQTNLSVQSINQQALMARASILHCSALF